MKIDSNMVKKLRTEKNWSQEQLSEASGLSLRTIQRLESGGNASIETLRALSEVFDIDPKALIISEEEEVMTPFDAVKNSLLKFADFSGTATRFEYWWFLAFFVLVIAIASVIHEQVYQIAVLILLLPFIAAGTRRLNDIGQSGWWQLLFFVPFGQIAVLFLLAKTNNNYPDKPKRNIMDAI